jgi:excisionase family DNA binding protein
MQLSLLAPQGEVEPARTSSPARAKRQTKLPAPSLKRQPASKPGETGLIERRSGRGRRPPGSGGRRGTDRVEARPAEAARAAAPASAAQPNALLPPENELWDLRAAARFLKLSTSWVYKRVEDGTLPVTRVNGYSLRFEPAALREWVAKNGSSRGVVNRKKK